MPPKKHAAPKTSMASATSTRAKRPRASTLNSVSDSVQVLVGETSSTRGTVSLDVSAILATVSAVVSQAIKTAFSPENIAVLLESSRAPQPILPVCLPRIPLALLMTLSVLRSSILSRTTRQVLIQGTQSLL